MARILVRGGKTKRHAPFRPSIVIRDTAYSAGHWQGMFFRPGVWCGMKTTRTPRAVSSLAGKANGKSKRRKATAETPRPDRDGRTQEGGPSDLILKALAKRPMSSLELITATKLEAPQVYGACNTLKKKGDIESKIDEDGDGTRRYFLVKGNL